MINTADLVTQAIDLLQSSRHTVALTGAGISTPSGIPDFRTETSGIWARFDPMEVATISAFKRRPEDFYEWIRPLLQIMVDAQPNPAHTALAQMEAYGPLKAIITQNIDLLHSNAGSQQVHELHGHIRDMTCLHCYQTYAAQPIINDFIDQIDMIVPRCKKCRGVLKPDVILYGEMLPVRVLNDAKRDIRQCDLMLVIGSSLEVAPAGDLPYLAKQVGARLIIINFTTTHMDYLADVVINADVVEILPQLADIFMP